jgi:hypothetical protein
MLLTLTFLSTVVAGAFAREPQGGPERPLETRVRAAALFKNGFAFVRREGEIQPGSKSLLVERLPVPVHGTFWLAADPAKVELGTAVARKTEIRERAPATDVVEWLRANVGREVSLSLSDKEYLKGTLVSVPDAALTPAEPSPPPYYYYGMPQPPGPSLVLVRNSSGTAALPLAEIRRAVIEGAEPAREAERRREAMGLTVAVEPKGDTASTLSILYLAKGLTWMPSYAIDLTDADKATLTAKAEVWNDVEDLAGATLQFVTGFPNLKFSHVQDPIAMRGELGAFLTSLITQPQPPGNTVISQGGSSNVARGRDDGFPVAGAPALGEGAEDLFFYEQKDVRLARGERGLYPLFTVRVPCEHLYEWSIPDTIDEDTYRRQQDQAPREEEVWHSVRLTNDTGMPWTTAPAMTTKAGKLLGQDQLNYAAVGSRTTLRITRAIDVQGEQVEVETARERGNSTFYGMSYDRVRVKGEIRVTNRKREAVRLEITKLLQGEVTKNPNEGKVVLFAKGLRRVNPNVRLTWTVAIEPGQTAAIEYEYSIFVRQ